MAGQGLKKELKLCSIALTLLKSHCISKLVNLQLLEHLSRVNSSEGTTGYPVWLCTGGHTLSVLVHS